jgi:predicted transposase YbfD/YdcC
MVSAWANANRLVLGQLKVDDKSNEITAIPQLLRMLELEGAIVTIDAMGCQKEIAKTITEQGAEYVLALKDNHPTLHGEVQLFFEDIKADRLDHITSAHHTTTDADHGRLETRHYWITSDIECVGVQGSWANIASVGFVESHCNMGGTVSIAQRFFLTSLPCDAVRFAQAVREHWGGRKRAPLGARCQLSGRRLSHSPGQWRTKYGGPAPYGIESVATRIGP